MLRQKVFYSGRVQGVGFRQAVASIAQSHPVQGWVRNLPDGRVEVAVEGEQSAVRAFLADVRSDAPGSVSSEQTQDWTTNSMHSGFRVRFDLDP
jgi:acylphosphatase